MVASLSPLCSRSKEMVVIPIAMGRGDVGWLSGEE